MFDCTDGQPLFVGSPAHLRWRDAFFTEAFNRPGVDEFVHLLRLIADLRIALRDVNDFDAFDHRKAGVIIHGECGFQCAVLGRRDALFQHCFGDVFERDLRPMADEAGVRAVFDDRRCARCFPSVDTFAQAHMAHVQGAVTWVQIGVIGIPQFD